MAPTAATAATIQPAVLGQKKKRKVGRKRWWHQRTSSIQCVPFVHFRRTGRQTLQ